MSRDRRRSPTRRRRGGLGAVRQLLNECARPSSPPLSRLPRPPRRRRRPFSATASLDPRHCAPQEMHDRFLRRRLWAAVGGATPSQRHVGSQGGRIGWAADHHPSDERLSSATHTAGGRPDLGRDLRPVRRSNTPEHWNADRHRHRGGVLEARRRRSEPGTASGSVRQDLKRMRRGRAASAAAVLDASSRRIRTIPGPPDSLRAVELLGDEAPRPLTETHLAPSDRRLQTRRQPGWAGRLLRNERLGDGDVRTSRSLNADHRSRSLTLEAAAAGMLVRIVGEPGPRPCQWHVPGVAPPRTCWIGEPGAVDLTSDLGSTCSRWIERRSAVVAILACVDSSRRPDRRPGVQLVRLSRFGGTPKRQARPCQGERGGRTYRRALTRSPTGSCTLIRMHGSRRRMTLL